MTQEDFLYRYNYVFNQLGKRILPQFFWEVNPDEMLKWQNQICRQTHMIVAGLLYKWIPKELLVSRRDIRVYESVFTDAHLGKDYDHSWIWLSLDWEDLDTGRTTEKSYLCDVARISEHIGFADASVKKNLPELWLLRDIEKTEKRKLLPFRELLGHPEFYSGVIGWELVDIIEDRLRDFKLHPYG